MALVDKWVQRTPFETRAVNDKKVATALGQKEFPHRAKNRGDSGDAGRVAGQGQLGFRSEESIVGAPTMDADRLP